METRRGPVVLITSPHAGHAEGHADAAAALRSAGVEVGRVLAVSELDEQLPQGKVWGEAGFVAAVAAGGDGTVGSVATQVAGTELPMGILPLGTANDVARSLAIPLNLEEACAVVARGAVREIDLGYARPAATEPGGVAAVAAAEASGVSTTPAVERSKMVASAGAYFVHTMTLGLNVEFARLATDTARRRRWGPLTYAASALEAVTHYRPIEVGIQLEGVVPSKPDGTPAAEARAATYAFRGPVLQVAVVVTPVFGGEANMRLPGVGLRDRLLDVIIVEALDPARMRTLVQGLLSAWRPAATPTTAADENSYTLLDLELPGVHWFKADALVVEQPTGLDVTLDGELRARTPVDVRTAPGALRVLMPERTAEEVLGEHG